MKPDDVERTMPKLAVELMKTNLWETAPLFISKETVIKVSFATGFHRMLLRAFWDLAKAELSTNPHMYNCGFVATEKSLANLSGMAVADRAEMVEMVAALQRIPVEWRIYDHNSQLAEKRRFAVIQEVRFLDEGQIRFFLAPTLLEVLHLSLSSSKPNPLATHDF